MEEVALKKESWVDRFFSWKGRLNRKRYFVRAVCLSLMTLILGFFLMYVMSLMEIDLASAGGQGIVLLLNAVAVCMGIPLALRRLHDLNQSGWWLIGYFFNAMVPASIPLLPHIISLYCFALSIYILFFRGTKGVNRYGEDPLGIE